MHYKNGRKANNGDSVVGKSYNGHYAGTLHSTNPGATSCNGQVAVPVPGGHRTECVTIGDIFHAEDAFKAAEASLPQADPAQTDTAAAPAN